MEEDVLKGNEDMLFRLRKFPNLQQKSYTDNINKYKHNIEGE